MECITQSERYRNFSYTHYPNTCTASPFSYLPPEGYQYHLDYIVYIKVHSWYCMCFGFGQICETSVYPTE